MKVLAIELSSREGSAAVADESGVRSYARWEETRRGTAQLFAGLPGVLERAGLVWGDVDVFAAGRGPGAFSGLRIALTAARALALPEGKPAYAVSSGEALAHTIAAETDAATIAVIGDARRDRTWMGLFDRGDRGPVLREDWALAPLGELPSRIPAGSCVVSPDWDRLAGALEALDAPGLCWVREPRYPSAGAVASVVLGRIRAGTPTDPLTPLYLHPPVFVPPKYAG